MSLLFPYMFTDKLPQIWGYSLYTPEFVYEELKNKSIEELIYIINTNKNKLFIKTAKELLVEKGFNLGNLIFL